MAVSTVAAADSGAKNPTSNESPNGQWTDAANALGDTAGTYMTTATNGAQQGFGTFGLGIPNGSIVNGITVSIVASSTDDSGCRLQAQLSGAGGSNLTSAKSGDLTNTDQTIVFGGATDTWGRVWDPTQTTNGNFRLVVRYSDPGQGCDNAAIASVDTITVKVDYDTIKDHAVDNDKLTKGVCDQADFNFVIDMSGSIGPQSGAPSNLPQIKDGINAFVTAFQAGGSGIYSGTTFNGTSASELTSGYVSAASFLGDVDGLSGPSGTTPTKAGINTGAGNDANDRAGVQNIMFVLTDGSPNVPGGDLADPATWLEAADAAIGAADDARSDYVVKAVYLSGPGDPGDTTLPFSNPDGDAAWATAVMTQIGGGSFLPADFASFVDELFEAIHCTPPSETSISTNASNAVNVGGDIHDVATLKGATDGAGGTITFNLYGPNDAECATSIFESKKAVDGSGDYTSGSFTTTETGTYRWVASYSGDDKNQPAAGECNDKDESVKVTEPNIEVTKLVATGDGDFGPTSQATPGDILHFKITVRNTGDGAAKDVAASDDISDVVAHGTYNADCNESCDVAGNVLSWDIGSIPGGDAVVLTYSVTLDATFPQGTTHLPNTVVVVGPGSNCPPAEQAPSRLATEEDCSTDTTVSQSSLVIDKTNDAPLVTLDLPAGGTADLPTADEGATVHYTLTYTFSGDPVSNGVITDVLPAGLQYVDGSAAGDDQFTFVSYDATARTLTWTAASVTKSGSVTYSALVLDGASELAQPLTNTAAIDSDQTDPDSDTSDVYVPTIPAAETDVPSAPPTDTLGTTGEVSQGPALLIILGLLGTLIVGVSYMTPARSAVRSKTRR